MPSTFDFHYVYTPTGSISGPSVLTQTEDAINDLGEYMSQSTVNADEALRQAQQAVSTANTAQQNATAAVSTADSALSRVQTLTANVEALDGRVTAAEGNAQNAVTTANSVLANAEQAVATANSAAATSQQAVTTANSALSTATQANANATQANANATQAVGTASSALTTAQNAEAIARQAVTDTDAIREDINADMETINQQVAAATAQAQTAQSAAAQAQGASDLSEWWATSTANRGSADEPDYTVDGDDYSSKWYALNVAQQWAVKMDGQVTADGTPGGTPVDFSSKYYATKAKEDAESAGAQASDAAQSATAAAGSASSAARDAGTASAKAAEAASSASAAASSQQAAASSASAAAESAAVLIGAVAFFAQRTVPAGWLICNGANVSRTIYASLFAAIGTTYGEGDGSTTFTLPNAHRRFLEATTTTSEVGGPIAAGLPNVTGVFGSMSHIFATGAFLGSGNVDPIAGGTSGGGVIYTDFSSNRSSAIYGSSSSVQPNSIRLLVCIKF